ncbi:hypothetical protein SAY86_019070 [Trapa natans]|uniref:Uncharacterized protein n=1 Tax=Trapa natans TaxID=22666 RepID=A0AAN7LS52_TRANT|nr:hypothetical protein SAY86_019070 [Trapa natans]
MPTLAAVAFDRLIEPAASESLEKASHRSTPATNTRHSNPNPRIKTKLERRNSTSDVDRKSQQPRIDPALYTTPDVTPVPGSPSAYSPSPYVINHKWRGPRLPRTFSEGGVSTSLNAQEEKGSQCREDGNKSAIASDGSSVSYSISKQVEVREANGFSDRKLGKNETISGNIVWEVGSSFLNDSLVVDNDSHKLDPVISKNLGDIDDFYDPQDSLSHTSNTDEDNSITHQFAKNTAMTGEFFDAWEELSSDNGLPTSSLADLEEELDEIKLRLLEEIEKRKQAEKTLTNMQSQWERIRNELYVVGITLPAHPTLVCEQWAADCIEDLRGQVLIARFVADAVGRGTARAEVETDMDAQIQAKNLEIARLLDRLHYYEAVNREMSYRNQEAFERARRLRQKWKRRQKWIWGSVAAAISLSTAAVLLSYLPEGNGTSSTSQAFEFETSMVDK